MMALKIIVVCFLMLPSIACALDFIPGLKGFGTDTRGPFALSNDPDICIVTSLGDTGGTPTDSTRGSVPVKEGTLRQCTEYAPAANTGKVILFETSGTINESTDDQYFSMTGNTYVAAQSAPSPGVTVRGIGFSIQDASDIIIQHIRMRYGNEGGGVPNWNDSGFRMAAYEGDVNQNIILDHCSLSWADDGNIDIFTQDETAVNDNINITNCISSEGLDNEGDGSKALSLSAWNAGDYTPGVTNFYAMRNIMASVEYRAPQPQGTSMVFINNLAYNIKDQVFNYVGGGTNVYQRTTMVNNVVKAGPTSGTYGGSKIFVFGTRDCDDWKQPLSGHKIYLYNNSSAAGTQSSSADWSMVDIARAPNCDDSMKVVGEVPINDAPDWPVGATYMPLSEVESYLKTNSGARPADRDSVDDCIITDITNGTGVQLSTTQDAGCGPWPNLAVNTITLDIPADPFAVAASGYTNLEEWLHQLAYDVEGAAPPVPPVTSGATFLM